MIIFHVIRKNINESKNKFIGSSGIDYKTKSFNQRKKNMINIKKKKLVL